MHDLTAEEGPGLTAAARRAVIVHRDVGADQREGHRAVRVEGAVPHHPAAPDIAGREVLGVDAVLGLGLDAEIGDEVVVAADTQRGRVVMFAARDRQSADGGVFGRSVDHRVVGVLDGHVMRPAMQGTIEVDAVPTRVGQVFARVMRQHAQGQVFNAASLNVIAQRSERDFPLRTHIDAQRLAERDGGALHLSDLHRPAPLLRRRQPLSRFVPLIAGHQRMPGHVQQQAAVGGIVPAHQHGVAGFEFRRVSHLHDTVAAFGRRTYAGDRSRGLPFLPVLGVRRLFEGTILSKDVGRSHPHQPAAPRPTR